MMVTRVRGIADYAVSVATSSIVCIAPQTKKQRCARRQQSDPSKEEVARLVVSSAGYVTWHIRDDKNTGAIVYDVF
jgi:hypothetical protein